MVTLYLAANEIELGDAVRIDSIPRTTRTSLQSIVGGRGDAYHNLGSGSNQMVLTGNFVGDTRYDLFHQLDRFRLMGRSLKLDTGQMRLPVFLEGVRAINETNRLLRYEAQLREARFWPIGSSENISEWANGSVAVTEDPTPMEGEYAIQVELSGSPITQWWTSPDPVAGVDLSTLFHPAVWYQASELTDELIFGVSDVIGNKAGIDLTDQLTVAEKWTRLLAHQAEFTEDGGNSDPTDWTAIYQIYLSFNNADNHTIKITVDDLGGYE